MYDDKSFETLIASKNLSSSERWYPLSVETYRKSLNVDLSIPNATALLKNLSYNLQYLEFLDKELKELVTSSVIRNMIIKNFVIVGMSIIEGLFVNIVKSNGVEAKSRLLNIGNSKTNQKKFSDDEQYIVDVTILKVVPEYDVQMNLDSLIKVLKSKDNILNIDKQLYNELDKLRDFRNRVHLQRLNSEIDHDYNAFSDIILKNIKEILYNILTCKTITDHPETFEFLNS